MPGPEYFAFCWVRPYPELPGGNPLFPDIMAGPA